MADRYWVLGTGNWDASTTTNWSTSSGGSGGASVPTSADNVIFDTLSNATAYTVTVTATANCADISFTNPLSGALTFAGSSTLDVYGNFTIVSAITRNYTGNISFRSTSTGKTITTNGISFSGAVTWTFSGVGGGWTFQDNLTMSNNDAISLQNGALNLNGKTFTLGIFTHSGSSATRSLTTGAATINLGNNSGVNFSATGFTLTAGTETWNITSNTPTITFAGTTAGTVTWNGTVSATIGSATFANLNITPGAIMTAKVIFSGNVIVTGTITITGNSSINRLLVSSSTKGTTRTITASTVTVTNSDFQDITGAGAGSWNLSAISGNSGDCGGNSGITFTSPVTTTCSAGTTWSTATWSSRIPLPQDTAIFSGSSRTITQDMPRIGHVDFTGSSGLTWTTSTACSVFGSIDLTDLATLTASTQTYTLEGRGSNTLKSASKTWSKAIDLNCPGGTMTLGDVLTIGTSSNLTWTSGTFTTNNNNVSTGSAITATFNATVNLGSSTIELTSGGSSSWNFSAGTLNAGTSTIKFSGALITNKTFTGGSKIYYNLWNATTGAFSFIVAGSNTFNDFKSDIARINKFTAATTQTVTTFTATGTAGNEITLDSTTTGTFTLTAPSRNNASPISCDYLNIQHCICTQANTWYAGANSVNNQGVATAGSGWIFTVPAIVASTNASFLFLMVK